MLHQFQRVQERTSLAFCDLDGDTPNKPNAGSNGQNCCGETMALLTNIPSPRVLYIAPTAPLDCRAQCYQTSYHTCNARNHNGQGKNNMQTHFMTQNVSGQLRATFSTRLRRVMPTYLRAGSPANFCLPTSRPRPQVGGTSHRPAGAARAETNKKCHKARTAWLSATNQHKRRRKQREFST